MLMGKAELTAPWRGEGWRRRRDWQAQRGGSEARRGEVQWRGCIISIQDEKEGRAESADCSRWATSLGVPFERSERYVFTLGWENGVRLSGV